MNWIEILKIFMVSLFFLKTLQPDFDAGCSPTGRVKCHQLECVRLNNELETYFPNYFSKILQKSISEVVHLIRIILFCSIHKIMKLWLTCEDFSDEMCSKINTHFSFTVTLPRLFVVCTSCCCYDRRNSSLFKNSIKIYSLHFFSLNV